MFKPYTHIVRLDAEDAKGILDGLVFVFPKLDGTNGSVWAEDGKVRCGGREREVDESDDDTGFAAWVFSDDEDAVALRDYVLGNPGCRFYGEWLPTEGTKLGRNYTVRRKFFVCDVYDPVEDRLLPYGHYAQMEDAYPYVVPPLAVVDCPNEDDIADLAERNHYLLPRPLKGEGVVVKNYGFENKFGDFAYAELVRSDAEKAGVSDGAPFERIVATDFVSADDVRKSVDKATVLGYDVKSSRGVAVVMEMCWKDLLEEETYNVVKRCRDAVIDFGRLRGECNAVVRAHLGL